MIIIADKNLHFVHGKKNENLICSNECENHVFHAKYNYFLNEGKSESIY